MGMVSIFRTVGLSVSHRIIIVLLTVILGLGVWSWRQSSEIDSLQATNQTQAQTIEQLNKTNEQLNNQLIAEQKAIEQQRELANQFKSQAERKREKVRVIFKNNQCANAHLPDGVIEQLQ